MGRCSFRYKLIFKMWIVFLIDGRLSRVFAVIRCASSFIRVICFSALFCMSTSPRIFSLPELHLGFQIPGEIWRRFCTGWVCFYSLFACCFSMCSFRKLLLLFWFSCYVLAKHVDDCEYGKFFLVVREYRDGVSCTYIQSEHVKYGVTIDMVTIFWDKK